MKTDPYVAEWMTREHVNDALTWAENERLVREAKGPSKAHAWRKSAWVALSILLGFAALLLG